MSNMQNAKNWAKHPFVSVVISNFNSKKMTYDCLKTVLKTDYPKNRYEIIVVDNGSQDGSIDFLKKEFIKEIKEKRIRIKKISARQVRTILAMRAQKENMSFI